MRDETYDRAILGLPSAPPADPGEWYVAFYGVKRMGWWDWVFTRPGFRHVMAFTYSSHAERWLIYDLARDRTFVRAYRSEAFDAWLAAEMPPEATILRVKSQQVGPVALHRLIFDCVSSVKHLVGSPSRALRPEALCRDLLATGAVYAFGTGPDEKAESRSPTGRSG